MGDVLGSIKEFYKHRYPNEFSDTVTVKKAKLSKESMEYYLETITSRSQEKEFERFCVDILEVEVCPNLISQTGPTGGGDSKVDSETYPVSGEISETWNCYSGISSEKDRWAFAFSAKKEWLPKVKSDVKKIAEVSEKDGRGFTKIFFVSNQFIPDKKRADNEDSLSAEYGIPVRIFDRSWLIDKIFNSNRNKKITVEAFGLSDDLFDSEDVGENDYAKKKSLEDVEEKLRSPVELTEAEKISLACDSLILSRELEYPISEIDKKIERYIRIVKKYGNKNDLLDCYYNCAWTVFWWYEDVERYKKYYDEIESIVLKRKDAFGLDKLITAWINLNSFALNNEIDSIKENTDKLLELYHEIIEDSDKPNAILKAKVSFQRMRLFLGDSINDIVNDYIELIKQDPTGMLVDWPSEYKGIECIPIIETAERYEELFEIMVDKISKQEKNNSSALILASRATRIMKDDPYKAISLFSRSLRKFYHKESEPNLLLVLLNLATLFEQIGLFWGARNFYMYVACRSMDMYFNEGLISRTLIASIDALKMIELRLGRCLFSSELSYLEEISRTFYDEITMPDDRTHYDALLSMEILKADYEDVIRMTKLPAYFDSRALDLTSIAIKYELGHYDEEMMNNFNQSTEQYDHFISLMTEQPAFFEMSDRPWFGLDDRAELKSNLLGCNIIVDTEKSAVPLELAASILATLESLYGTGISNKLVAMTGQIRIVINTVNEPDFDVKVTRDEENPTIILVEVTEWKEQNFVTAQKVVRERMIEIVADVTQIMFPYEEMFQRAEETIKSDESIIRAELFSNSIFVNLRTFGDEVFDYDSLCHDMNETPINREHKAEATSREVKCCDIDESDKLKDYKIIYGESPEQEMFKNMSNVNITTGKVINIHLWNIAEWKGVMYMMFPGEIPLLGFVYENAAGKRIFRDWIDEIGCFDEKNGIGIRIIKGIDQEHQLWYRVAVGDNDIPHISDRTVFANIVRFHTMQPETDSNLLMFEKQVIEMGEYNIAPVLMEELKRGYPKIEDNLVIRKQSNSLKIQNGYEVDLRDTIISCAILPTDNPFVPDGKNADELLDFIRKKQGKCDN